MIYLNYIEIHTLAKKKKQLQFPYNGFDSFILLVMWMKEDVFYFPLISVHIVLTWLNWRPLFIATAADWTNDIVNTLRLYGIFIN